MKAKQITLTSPAKENNESAIAMPSFKPIDFDKLIFSDEIITTAQALADAVDFDWSEDVIAGKRKVII